MTPITLDGIIGLDVLARDIREQLHGAGDIELQISSPGGDVPEGLAIYNALRDHRRAGHQVNARIVGLAASMATYIPMVADRITVEDNAVLMIHNAWGLVIGDHRTLRQTADVLDGLSRTIARAYAERTGADLNAIRQQMDDETWLFGADIVAAGYADALEPAGDGAETSDEALAAARARFSAMIAKLREREQPAPEKIAALLPHPPATPATHDPEPTMPNSTADSAAPTASESAVDVAAIQAEAAATERDRILAILNSDEAKGREAVAAKLAATPAMTAESAAAVLAAMPKAGAEPAWSADSGEIRQTTDAAAPATPKPAAIDYDAIYAARRSVTA